MTNKNKKTIRNKNIKKGKKIPKTSKIERNGKITALNIAAGIIKKFITSNKPFVFTTIIVVVLDKFSKILIKHTYTNEIEVLGNFFKITLIENRGIAFGFFSEWTHPLKTILLLILSLGALLFIGNIYYKSDKTLLMEISFGLIFGGAFGNIYDRLIYQKVIDFLNFGIGNYRWPFFNIADSCITIGVIIIMLLTLFKKEES